MGFLDRARRAMWGRLAEPDRRTVCADASGPVQDAGAAGQPLPEDQVPRRQERAAERLLEDERLRGSLTDDEFGPLLQWALATVDRVAATTAGQPDALADRRIDEALAAIHRVIGTIDRALTRHSEGSAREVAAELRSLPADAGSLAPPGEQAGARARLSAALDRLLRQRAGPSAPGDDQTGRAALTRRLADALGKSLQAEDEVLE